VRVFKPHPCRKLRFFVPRSRSSFRCSPFLKTLGFFFSRPSVQVGQRSASQHLKLLLFLRRGSISCSLPTPCFSSPTALTRPHPVSLTLSPFCRLRFADPTPPLARPGFELNCSSPTKFFLWGFHPPGFLTLFADRASRPKLSSSHFTELISSLVGPTPNTVGGHPFFFAFSFKRVLVPSLFVSQFCSTGPGRTCTFLVATPS